MPIIIYNNVLPFPGYRAVNLFGIIFARGDSSLPEHIITHETTHTKQMLETLFIGFYIWYLLEFLIKLAICLNWDRAYRSISFEQEAYAFEDCPYWPDQRGHYNWCVYVFRLISK